MLPATSRIKVVLYVGTSSTDMSCTAKKGLASNDGFPMHKAKHYINIRVYTRNVRTYHYQQNSEPRLTGKNVATVLNLLRVDNELLSTVCGYSYLILLLLLKVRLGSGNSSNQLYNYSCIEVELGRQ